jgi:hypothetical protein
MTRAPSLLAGETLEQLRDSIERFVNWELGSSVRLTFSRDADSWRLSLPRPEGADYEFDIVVGESGLLLLTATNGALRFPRSWYVVLRVVDKRLPAPLSEFLLTIRSVLRSPTRLEISAGRLLERYECFAKVGTSWRSLGATGVLRLRLRLPPRQSLSTAAVSSLHRHDAALPEPEQRDALGTDLLRQQQTRYPFIAGRAPVSARIQFAIMRLVARLLLFWRPRQLREVIRDLSIPVAPPPAPVQGLPDQNPGFHEHAAYLLLQVEQSCLSLGLKPLRGVVAGTIANPRLGAEARRYFDAASVLTVNDNTFLYCHLLAKAITPLVIPLASRSHSNYEEIAGRERLAAIERLADLLAALTVHDNASRAMPYPMSLLGNHQEMLIELREGMELFVVAHEYSHLTGAAEGPPSEASDRSGYVASELAADRFALLVVYENQRGRPFPKSFVLAPALLMRVFGLLERANIIPPPVSHPPSELRSEALLSLLAPDSVLGRSDPDWSAEAVARWNDWCRNLDLVWQEVLTATRAKAAEKRVE